MTLANKPAFKFIIWTPPYDEFSGGIIALHKLCHLLNQTGNKAFLQPATNGILPAARRAALHASDRIPAIGKLTGKNFYKNPSLDTPLLPFGFDWNPHRSITIYPEIVDGNPLGAKHVVRWFLHKPGFHTGRTDFGIGEMHVDFNEFLRDYQPKQNYLSKNSLYVTHFPIDLYNLDGAAPEVKRQGSAYCVRKGKIDSQIDLGDAVCIDGLSHGETASIFKRVKYFYSFDPYTAYSPFAALCGAISVVVPPAGMTKDSWYPQVINRYGIAFGLGDLEWAVSTQDRVLPVLLEREQASINAVRRFVNEATDFFSGQRE